MTKGIGMSKHRQAFRHGIQKSRRMKMAMERKANEPKLKPKKPPMTDDIKKVFR